MKTMTRLAAWIATACAMPAMAQSPAVAIDADDIGGTVTGAEGPEAGVWVIAETHDLGTRYAKIVVTDERGRYLVPDLPKASYIVWVRGYGLADSEKKAATPGKSIDLSVAPARDAAAAARIYPAAYWYAMMKLPDAAEVAHLPGKRNEYLMWMKNMACVGCHQMGTFHAPVRDPDTPTTHSDPVVAPSPYWNDEPIWDSKANAHNPMLDHKGRVWYTARIRAAANPAFCRQDSKHPSAQRFPTDRSGRQLAVYEPATKRYTFVDTCFGTHHLQFAEDANHTLWTSGGGPVVGWLDTKKFDATGDAAASQGWAPLVLDTNGNGKLDKWTEPDQPVDAQLDRRIAGGYYAVMPNPADGSVWGSVAFRYPGALVRFDPRSSLTELYNVPAPGYGVRGADIDRNGVVWVSLGSGHLGEFDRRKCKSALRGPQATGDQCPEGWAFHRLPGPSFAGDGALSVESSYYTWVDQHDTLGLGANVPIATGNLFDGVHALVAGKFVTLRIPYPLGFYTKGFEGRIDDARAGWKGRGLWVPSGDRTPWHKEGGKATKPLVVHFQMRPAPLGK